MGQIINPGTPVFINGPLCGLSRSQNVHEFLDDTATKLCDLLASGMQLRHNRETVVVLLHSAVADAFVHKSIKQANQQNGHVNSFRYTKVSHETGEGFCPILLVI